MLANRLEITLLTSVVAAVLTASVVFVLRSKPEEHVRAMGRRYHPVSMEGFSTTLDGVGIAFDTFDVQKMKLGGITLGGFNVLIVKNLCLTLHEKDEESVPRQEQKPSSPVSVVLPSSVVDHVFALRSFVAPNLQISAVNVTGLTIRKVKGEGAPVDWLEAKSLKNVGRQLRFAEVVLNTNGVRQALGDARLAVNGGYFIEYGPGFNQRLNLIKAVRFSHEKGT